MDIFFREYNYEEAKKWLIDDEAFLFKCIGAYIVVIFAIKYVMRIFKPFDLNTPLILWNALLAVFSVVGFVKMTPTFIYVLYHHGVQHSYTKISELQTDKVCGYWAFLWIVSKIPELIDTIFIVLRKRPLMFMHWYHHVVTGYYAYVNFYEDNAYMIWTVYMNYFIHALMYAYYAARAIGIRIPPNFAQLLTAAQIIQFTIAHVIMGHVLVLWSTTNDTYAVSFRGFLIGAIMEVSYLLLWFRFYYISYIAGGGKKYLAHSKVQQKTIDPTNGTTKIE
ncbi:GNS1/SUR4 family domain-containing protein [Ditylenchus destructor]|uniref:Elongation of very long chain fatty acids protein n=1 Tax=Ditylenchus destructor TaxID=166010 RepID=A0AAD4MU10_9BILA|nr:GNS1/SUR4 family domain-containing protein [Ditylenchus destructor]